MKPFLSLAHPRHLAEAVALDKSLARQLVEMAAGAENDAARGESIVIDSITPAYEQELAQAFESGRQWGKFKPYSAPLRARGWRWTR